MDVINFAQSKAAECLQNENLIDKESASLLWSFIVLLCRQNGVRVSFLVELLFSWASSPGSPQHPRGGLGGISVPGCTVQGLPQDECLGGDLGTREPSRVGGLG